MKTCCSCEKESLIYPYVCAECLGDLKTLKDENKDLRRLLNKASQILQNNGFENESKAIDCMAEL